MRTRRTAYFMLILSLGFLCNPALTFSGEATIQWNVPVNNVVVQRKGASADVPYKVNMAPGQTATLTIRPAGNTKGKARTIALRSGENVGVVPGVPVGVYTFAVEGSGGRLERRVAVGDVFLVAGQSNALSMAFGRDFPVSTTGEVSVNLTMGTDASSADADAPKSFPTLDYFVVPSVKTPALTSYSWIKCGDMLVKRFGVPVCFVNVSVYGSNSAAWAAGAKHYSVLAKALAQIPCRAVLWMQGESDVRNLSEEDSYANMKSMIEAAKQINPAPWIVALNSARVEKGGGEHNVRKAQKKIIAENLAMLGPDTDTLRYLPGCTIAEGIEVVGPGLDKHAQLWFETLARYLSDKKL